MADQDVAIALEEAKLAILGRITASTENRGAAGALHSLANAYALLEGTVKPASAAVGAPERVSL